MAKPRLLMALWWRCVLCLLR
uniref:CKX3 n=1 Tax=Arundo donax TaxID=35708 RepID=A0A0A9G4C7_ARUDO